MDFTVGDRVRSLRWPGEAGRLTGRIEPGEETNEDSIRPRLFVHFDGTSFEREVEPHEIERTTA